MGVLPFVQRGPHYGAGTARASAGSSHDSPMVFLVVRHVNGDVLLPVFFDSLGVCPLVHVVSWRNDDLPLCCPSLAQPPCWARLPSSSFRFFPFSLVGLCFALWGVRCGGRVLHWCRRSASQAASERDQRSPHHSHRLPRYSTSLLHHRRPDTTSPRSGTLDAFLRRDIPKNPALPTRELRLSLLGIHQQDTTGPLARGRPSLVSVPGRSLTLDGPTACLMPTHRTRRTISRHSPSPTSHDAST
ncbi:hypothetical protein B0H14DRAFT_3891603, partial [Mycena olivaceomarginata]